ncbi:hypothetical protein D3X68_14565, partial [Acinetobacter baumannii]
VNIQGLPAYEAYNEKFQMLLPSGEPMKKVDYKISTDGNEYISQADDKGRSKRIHTSKEENLKLDLNWISFEADSADNNGDAK